MSRKSFLIVIALFFIGGFNNVFSQEWEFLLEYHDSDDKSYSISDVIELSDGNFVTASGFYYRSGYGDFYSEHPACIKLSSDGEELYRNNFFIPGYCTQNSPYIFEKNNSIYALTSYSPDHDKLSFNYFMNYDNPPSDAKIVLMKLDEELNMEEYYEHSWRTIDISENYDENNPLESLNPNEACGNIFIFSAFEEDDNIVGAYFKTISGGSPSGGNDTLFFFKMDFNGEFVYRKGYPLDYGGHNSLWYRRNHIVATDSLYIFYDFGSSNFDGYFIPGHAKYYDKDFNFITEKYLHAPYCQPLEELYNITVKRSNHNTTYLTTSIRSIKNPTSDEDHRIYEIDDDINYNNAFNYLNIVNYTDRETDEWDIPAILSGVDIADDNSIYCTYSLNNGYNWNLDSWIMIEHLENDFDTISTLFYDINNGEGRVFSRVKSIKTTNDGGLIIIGDSEDLDSDACWKFLTKILKGLFVSIEEAHAHNLKVAVAYPNPGGDVMNIRTALRNCTLQVYDMQGRMVHQQEITDDVTSVDASGWKSRTYVWELGTEYGNGSGNGILESGKWVK